MYLKSLVLKGFKTFPEKTTLDFRGGGSITGIVGPNGCGKSNILDSVRWVLGEQSIKTLRANLQEEIIFAGTQERAPLSMAEVTLFFDNSDHLLPVDFAEVAIRRRIFREGESEFFINKASCRLKDIKDLLMDTGLGANSYSIINQGEVDSILLSSPEDRRRIFEEVAGINRYRVRKEAAEKKLINVEQHLLRLNDLKVEISEQLVHLEEQANKARQYQEGKARLKELEIGLCKKQLQGFSERLNEWQQKIENLKTEVENTGKEKQAELEKRQQLRAGVRELEEEERRAREELSRGTSREEIRNNIFAKERELSEARNQRRDLEEKQRFALYEAEKARLELGKLETALSELLPQKQSLEAALVSLRQEVGEVQNNLQIKSRGELPGEAEQYLLDQLGQRLEELQSKVEELLEQLAGHLRVNTIEEFMDSKDHLVILLSKFGETKQAIRELTTKAKEVTLTRKVSGQELSNLQAREKDLSHKLVGEEFRLRALVEEAERATVHIQLSRQTIETRGKEAEELNVAKAALETEIKSLEEQKQILEQGLNKGIEDLTGKLEDLGRKREQLETQIEEAENQSLLLDRKDLDLRGELNRAEIQIAKMEGESQSIGSRIWDEYNLALTDILNSTYEVAIMSKAKEEISAIRAQLHALEPVNLLAIDEFTRTKERMGVIDKGYLDLMSSRENLKSLILELDKKARENFLLAIEVVGRNFSEIFAGLFEGGEAQIKLVGEEEDVLKAGVEIFARPSGRKMLTLSALSGGEKALTAISLLFALLKTHPTPFCFLDEVDAPLDEANVYRFTKLLKDFSHHMQIIVITHNKNTMAAVDTLYGVTMEEPGVSKIISMKLAQVA